MKETKKVRRSSGVKVEKRVRVEMKNRRVGSEEVDMVWVEQSSETMQCGGVSVE